MTIAEALVVEGIGLVTGAPARVRLEQAPAGHGIVFYPRQGDPIPARLASIADTERGVTLANRQGQILSIVEHFLCACSLAGLSDLKVHLEGAAPELPILDGSARPWLDHLRAHFGQREIPARYAMKNALYYRHNDDIAVYALPSDYFRVSYAVNFAHPGLMERWVHWDSRKDDMSLVADARTFGFVRELPYPQAKGLGMGVRPENTLGLTDEGGYTDALRFDDEPVYHKILDLIGDLTLSGINPLGIRMHVFAVNAGHAGHTAFARRLCQALAD